MGHQKWSEIRDKKFSKEHIDQVREETLQTLIEMNLSELRQHTGKTQSELAELMRAHQSELSRIERREDHMLSTLRQYIEALGGEIEISAIIGDERIRLIGV